MQPANTIVIMADEFRRDAMGCAGHPIVQTPHLDALAARGTRFTAAYTPSPICVPARAAFATGRQVHEIGTWCNAHPYSGNIESWHHRVRAAGHHVRSIGKLHFRGGPEDDTGFSASDIPMNVVGGVGDALGLVRDEIIPRGATDKLAAMAGPGESDYTAYDRDILTHCRQWLDEEAQKQDRPWVLFVSFVCPHYPLTAPQEFYDLYDRPDLPMPKLYAEQDRPHHPFLSDFAGCVDYDAHFKSEADVRRAIAGYYGLCSFIDSQVGAIVEAVENAGLTETTRVAFTSDHGESLGARGMWGKSNMYEESAGIPLIVAGPSVPEATVEHAPRSLIDLSRFVLTSAGLPGDGFGTMDLFSDEQEPVISEYHATGSLSGAWMVRHKNWKYVHYALYAPQLFDLGADPEELTDLASDPAYAEVLNICRGLLEARLDPQAVHDRALADQGKRLAELGGRDAVVKRGDFGFSPPPGVDPAFS
ncbi:sulfatase-like hydrolase/transferase [Marinovum sp. 2_MG-2023]|uniref:sulfatase-like hydrolase/transferase n=1 Tax=unclassified Marinovum TaxID=2647166 RepID=UPI0026E37998|nr:MULTISPECIES: sulfatase-like hydrolase/transferase [unclassified Marinovum]MDO6732275.1 sulfatase-like hydrolase/transferase [Marinovum sp. 2_MG-2023]MDO6781592.1 sulfatase-like hydrolase/transferase [Marinovum sp. 1_MG-2023]